LLPCATAARIGATAGLWLKEPDIDATAWLNGKVESVGYTGPNSLVLDQNTWTPINTQNTSVTRDLVPGFLCIPMGHDVPGGKIQRYGDIWGGYILQAVMRGTDYHVSFGRPLVEHRRNPHDYLDDLRFEFWGMILTDWITALLRDGFTSTATRPIERMKDIGAFFKEQAICRLPKWCPPQVRDFIVTTSNNIILWSQACSRVGA
jgi:hypothetical protein